MFEPTFQRSKSIQNSYFILQIQIQIYLYLYFIFIGASPALAQIRISGNSFGNKGCSVILSFRKYPRKYAYPGQKVALAPGEISGQGGRKVRCGRVCKASLEATQLAPRGPAGIAVQARAERMAPQSVQQYCGQRSAVSSQSSISAVTSLLSPVMCQVVRSRVSDSATHGVEQRDGPVEGAQGCRAS